MLVNQSQAGFTCVVWVYEKLMILWFNVFLCICVCVNSLWLPVSQAARTRGEIPTDPPGLWFPTFPVQPDRSANQQRWRTQLWVCNSRRESSHLQSCEVRLSLGLSLPDSTRYFWHLHEPECKRDIVFLHKSHQKANIIPRFSQLL